MFPLRKLDGYMSSVTQRSIGAVKINEDLTGLLYKLLLQQGTSEVRIESFDRNSINYQYFKTIFKKVVENKIGDPRGRLIRLIKYTQGEAKLCIQQPYLSRC